MFFWQLAYILFFRKARFSEEVLVAHLNLFAAGFYRFGYLPIFLLCLKYSYRKDAMGVVLRIAQFAASSYFEFRHMLAAYLNYYFQKYQSHEFIIISNTSV
jgi:hypothetical protein